MKNLCKLFLLLICGFMPVISLSGCASVGNGKQIVRIAHSQAETHPEHIGLAMAFS